MGRNCIRARKGGKHAKEERKVLCACQEDRQAFTFKMKRNCGPPTIEAEDLKDSSTEKSRPISKVKKDHELPSKQKQDHFAAPVGDENLHAKLEAIIRNSGYGTAAWIIETSKLFI